MSENRNADLRQAIEEHHRKAQQLQSVIKNFQELPVHRSVAGPSKGANAITLIFLMLMVIAGYWPEIENAIHGRPVNLSLSDSALILLYVLLALELFLTIVNGPKEPAQLQNWKWKIGRASYLMSLIRLLLVAILSMVFGTVFGPVFGPNLEVPILVFMLGCLCGIAFFYIVFKVVQNPAAVISMWLTSIGSIMYLCWIASVLYGFLVLALKEVNLFILIFAFFQGYYLFIFLFSLGKNKLNIVQEAALTISHPTRILFALQTEIADAKNRMRAVEDIEGYIQRDEIGVLAEIAKELARQYTRPQSSPIIILGGLIASVLIFVLVAVGQGIIQELLSSPLTDFLCRSLQLSCGGH